MGILGEEDDKHTRLHTKVGVGTFPIETDVPFFVIGSRRQVATTSIPHPFFPRKRNLNVNVSVMGFERSLLLGFGSRFRKSYEKFLVLQVFYPHFMGFKLR